MMSHDCAVAVTNYAALAAYAYMGKKSAFVILAYATGVYAWSRGVIQRSRFSLILPMLHRAAKIAV